MDSFANLKIDIIFDLKISVVKLVLQKLKFKKYFHKLSHVKEEDAKYKDLRGFKQSKERLTIQVGVYIDAEKMLLHVIGKSTNLRCFRGSPILSYIEINQMHLWTPPYITNIFLNSTISYY